MSLKVKDLHKSYPNAESRLVIVDSLSFDFPESGTMAIIGRSGVGKSTFLHMLSGLDTFDSGEIYWGDQTLSSLNSDEKAKLRGRDMGFVFQFHHLLPEFNAVENVALPLLLQGMEEKEALGIAEGWIARVGLKERTLHKPFALSGGEQQRVSVARALVHSPKILFADEPTGNLDVQNAQIVSDLLINLAKTQGTLLIIATHSLELAKRMDHAFEFLPGGRLEEAFR